jgi:hypothetical protein
MIMEVLLAINSAAVLTLLGITYQVGRWMGTIEQSLEMINYRLTQIERHEDERK